MRRLAVFALLVAAAVRAEQRFKIPPAAPPEIYGDMLIWRTTANAAVKPVMFSHLSHRIRYTCRVCHLELDFAFKRNTTEITEAANRAGSYCGACHNGKIAFAHTTGNCAKCHTGNVAPPIDAKKIADLPWSAYGNRIDWSAAIENGSIKPLASLAPGYKPIPLDTTLTIEAEWNFVPPATFPHTAHVRWLDCANCHPSIFNVKKKSTHYSMQTILSGEYCGTCHLRVAFPLDDCRRCHPEMKRDQVN